MAEIDVAGWESIGTGRFKFSILFDCFFFFFFLWGGLLTGLLFVQQCGCNSNATCLYLKIFVKICNIFYIFFFISFFLLFYFLFFFWEERLGFFFFFVRSKCSAFSIFRFYEKKKQLWIFIDITVNSILSIWTRLLRMTDQRLRNELKLSLNCFTFAANKRRERTKWGKTVWRMRSCPSRRISLKRKIMRKSTWSSIW